jgi:hypothetical protein
LSWRLILSISASRLWSQEILEFFPKKPVALLSSLRFKSSATTSRASNEPTDDGEDGGEELSL